MVIWVNLVICLHLWFCSFTSCTHSSRGPAKSKMKQGMWAKMSTHQYLTAKSTGLIGNYLLKPSMFILKEIYCRKIKEWFRNAITREKVAVNAPSMNFHFHYVHCTHFWPYSFNLSVHGLLFFLLSFSR